MNVIKIIRKAEFTKSKNCVSNAVFNQCSNQKNIPDNSNYKFGPLGADSKRPISSDLKVILV